MKYRGIFKFYSMICTLKDACPSQNEMQAVPLLILSLLSDLWTPENQLRNEKKKIGERES